MIHVNVFALFLNIVESDTNVESAATNMAWFYRVSNKSGQQKLEEFMVSMDTVPAHSGRMEPDEPWEWLAAGWRDVLAGPGISLTYGVAFTIVSLGLAAALFYFDMPHLLLPLSAGFMLIGPMLAVGLYETSRRRQAGEPVSLRTALFVPVRNPTQLALLGVMLMAVHLIWIRIATLLYALFLGTQPFPGLEETVSILFFTFDGLGLLVVGTAFGGVLAAAVFALTAFSVPILMVRDVDAVTAVLESVRMVRQNLLPMLVWAWLIVMLTAVGIVTCFVGLAITFPLIGHATWHAYRRAFDDVRPGA